MAYMDIGGLYQKYGLEQVVPMAGGEYLSYGETRVIEFKIALTALSTTATIVTGTDNVEMPAGFTVESIELVADTAATSAGLATLDVGLVRKDRTTAISANGLVAAGTLASINATGSKVTLIKGSATAGALVGTTVGANPGHFTANYTTAAFTAGVVTVRVKYRKPQ